MNAVLKTAPAAAKSEPENVEFKVSGDKLIITVPNLGKRLRPSSTGKTVIIADAYVKLSDTHPGTAFSLKVYTKDKG